MFFFFFLKNYQIHHPGSKKQLEEVWEKQDEMEGENFNPRTFFAMHGKNFKVQFIQILSFFFIRVIKMCINQQEITTLYINSIK